MILGKPDALIDIVKSFYEGVEQLDQGLQRRLRQNSGLAPMLFNMYVCLCIVEQW